MTVSDLPAVNASLNATTAVLLLAGLIFILRGNKTAHQRCMIAAFITSAVFLSCYLYYHAHHGVTKFPRTDWTRTLYLTILGTHTLLAIVVLPIIFVSFYRAFKGNFEAHKRMTRWAWPIWMYVSVTGVLVYFMLYRWFAV